MPLFELFKESLNNIFLIEMELSMANYIIGGIIIILIILAFIKIRKDRKKGGCSGCSGCPHNGSCDKNK